MKGKLPGNHITNETSKRFGVRPQKETTPENLIYIRVATLVHIGPIYSKEIKKELHYTKEGNNS